jgi:hypothetical protein
MGSNYNPLLQKLRALPECINKVPNNTLLHELEYEKHADNINAMDAEIPSCTSLEEARNSFIQKVNMLVPCSRAFILITVSEGGTNLGCVVHSRPLDFPQIAARLSDIAAKLKQNLK